MRIMIGRPVQTRAAFLAVVVRVDERNGSGLADSVSQAMDTKYNWHLAGSGMVESNFDGALNPAPARQGTE